MTQLLRASGISPAILPIIIMSSHGSKSLVEAAYESGGNDWMSKPINMQEAGARVREQVRPSVKPATRTPSLVVATNIIVCAACLTCATVDYY